MAPFPGTTSGDDDSWRITTQGGFPGSWVFCLSKGSSLSQQIVFTPEGNMEEPIIRLHETGYHITSLAGDAKAWTVTGSQTEEESPYQSVGSFDQEWIADSMKQGLAITGIAGWMNRWMVVMEEGKGWGKQRFSLPSDFGAKRRAWIESRWAEGYRITSLAGDETEEGKPGSWVVVVSQGTGLGQQVISPLGPWPSDWIAEQAALDYRVTSLAGYDKNWIVVMSQGSGLGEQKFVGPGEFNAEGIKEFWSE